MHTFYNRFRLMALAATVCFCYQNAQAQDPHFSQFYAAPTQVNPALAGVFAGEFRFVANYRTQQYAVLGNQAYKTMAASLDVRRKAGRNDFFSLGLAVMRDEVGSADFTQSNAALTGSYLKQLSSGRRGSGQFLVGGAQLGVAQWKLDWNDLWFSEQFVVDAGSRLAYIDYEAASGELTGISQTDMFLNFNAGLLYYNVIDQDNSIYLGGAFHHLNEPNVSFMDNPEEKLYRRWLVQAGGQLALNRTTSLLPALILMQQGPSMQALGGMNLRYNNRDWREVAIRAGMWGRLANQLESGMAVDAMIVSFILEMERWQFGLSYDVTTSNLKEANNSRGAFELSLIYTQPAKQRFRVNCPKF